MYKQILKKVTIISVVLLSIAYSFEKKPCCNNSESGIIKDNSGIDGCTFIIELNNGEKLNVINLSTFDIIIEDGKEVMISYQKADDIGGICMVGKIVEANCICEK